MDRKFNCSKENYKTFFKRKTVGENLLRARRREEFLGLTPKS